MSGQQGDSPLGQTGTSGTSRGQGRHSRISRWRGCDRSPATSGTPREDGGKALMAVLEDSSRQPHPGSHA